MYENNRTQALESVLNMGVSDVVNPYLSVTNHGWMVTILFGLWILDPEWGIKLKTYQLYVSKLLGHPIGVFWSIWVIKRNAKRRTEQVITIETMVYLC